MSKQTLFRCSFPFGHNLNDSIWHIYMRTMTLNFHQYVINDVVSGFSSITIYSKLDYLCFDKITKNIWNTKYPQMWGENVRERNYQCSLGTLTISLPGLVQMGMRRLATCGGPETLSLIWLWAKKTLWIRHIPQSTRIIVPSRTSCTRSHSPRAALYILLLYQFIHSSLT